MATEALPVLDFGVFRTGDAAARARLLDDIRDACKDRGFFQLTNHGISQELQDAVLSASRSFFALPLEEKMKCALNSYNRGYEQIGAQMLEPGSAPDTKEAIYLGEDLALDHPRVQRGDYNCGPNLYPERLGQPFKDTTMDYYYAARGIAQDVMRALAVGLGLEEKAFDSFTTSDPTCSLRLVRYPPTPRTTDRERGIGAHRDFGCVTCLLQDGVGGLQVQDEVSGGWLDVTPIRGALVVNLGNTMMRWTNHHYTSNTHRVLNFSGKDRYSVVFFFNGNPQQTISTVPGCEVRRDTSQKLFGPPVNADAYGPILVRDYVSEQFKASYARANQVKVNITAPEPVVKNVPPAASVEVA